MTTPSSSPPAPSPWRDVLPLAVITLAYFSAFQIAFLLPDAGKVVAAVWPASGIGLAALLLNPRRRWPAIVALLYAVGVIANLLGGRPLITSLGLMTANVLESVVCAVLLLRWRGPRLTFTSVADITALLGAATFVNAGTALIGAGTAALTAGASFWSFWATWWVSNGLGLLLLTPLILTWSTLSLSRLRRPNPRLALEAVLFTLLWGLAAWQSFQLSGGQTLFAPRPYMLLVLVAWPAVRLGSRWVTLAMIMLAIIAVTSPAVSLGPLPWGGTNALERLLLVQIFLAAVTPTGLLLAAAYAETKAAEQASREDQARLRALGDNLPGGAVFQIMATPEGTDRFIYVSAGIEPLTGLSPETLQRDAGAFFNIIAEEDRPRYVTAQQASAQGLDTFRTVIRIRQPGGQMRWLQVAASPRRLPTGETVWDGVCLDVTEHQQAEEARLAAQARFREALEFLPVPVSLADQQGQIVFFNREFTHRYGYTREDIPTIDDWMQHAYPDPAYRAMVQALWGEVQTREPAAPASTPTRELSITCKDGTTRQVEIDTRVLGDTWLSSFVDVTERRQAEAARLAAQARFREALEFLPIPVGLADQQGRILFYNREFTQRYGYTREDIPTIDDWMRLAYPAPAYREEVLAQWREDEAQILENPGANAPREFTVTCKDGSLRQVEVEVRPFGDALLASFTNVTERRQAEEAVHRLNANLEERVAARTAELTQANQRLEAEIAERQRVEQALQNQAELLALTGQTAHVGGWEFDPQTMRGAGTDEAARIYDLDPAVGTSLEQGLHFYLDPHRQALEHAMREVVALAKPYDLELELVTAKGVHKWVRAIGRPILKDGRVVKVFGSLQDITERRRTDQALQAQAQLLTLTGQTAHVGGWEFDAQTMAAIWTDEAIRIHDFDPVEMPNVVQSFDCYQGAHRETIENAVREAVAQAKPYDLELEMVTAQGNRKWVRVIGQPVVEGGRVVRVYGSLQDITERVRAEAEIRQLNAGLEQHVAERTEQLETANRELRGEIAARRRVEEALRDAQQRYQTIFENSIEGIFQSTPEGRFLRVNPAMARIFGYASPEAMVTAVGNQIVSRIHVSPDRRAEFTRRLDQHGHLFDFEAQNYRQDGGIIWTRTSARAVRDAAGAVAYYEGFLEDITERKTAERLKAETEYYYRQVVDHSGVGIVALDTAGRCILVNALAAKRMGGSPRPWSAGRYSRSSPRRWPSPTSRLARRRLPQARAKNLKSR
jgi:PAS domain S-box-containing protein